MTTAPGQAAPASPSSTSPPQTSEHSDGDGNQTDGRKGYGKRELSTSKRAAQNRAAQRAFRQRKEGYIKKLEEQVRDYQVLSDNFKTVQAENYQLRDYIINLQSRLLESQHEVPPPPSSVDGLSPGKVHPQLHSQHPSIPAVNPQPSQPHQGQTLPRIAEMGNSRTTPPHDSVSGPKEIGQQYGYTEQASKRLKTSPTVTPSQSALQGNAVLNQSPTPR
ncbi:hypothetical protein LTR64_002548 [Lithohypha guttulata]|uniref:Putative transcription factor kapC n=1 Tax=Lithohypha guttulata TaxID=1690604 RepID=A0AAN7SWN1_9EURO|nr:hypothetical protein LTR05_006121 [Lithohypha guttulata]